MDYASQRAEQLRKHIQDSLQLLKEYEDKLHLADDLKEKERCQHEITKLKESVQRWEVELTSLEAAPGAMPSPRPKAPPPPPTALGRWWASLSDPVKVAIIGLASAILVAFIGLFTPIVEELARYVFSRPATLTPMPSPTGTRVRVGEVTATPTATSTSMHTATPTPSEEVNEFVITKQEMTVTVKPGTTITATVREIVQIKAELSITHEEQEMNLVFTWYTCVTGSRSVLEKIGNPEMLYVAPSEPVRDCICVTIEEGGELLAREEIFVDVQE